MTSLQKHSSHYHIPITITTTTPPPPPLPTTTTPPPLPTTTPVPPHTHVEDLVPAEAEGLRLLAGGECGVEGLAGSRGSGRVRVTLGQQPVAHQAFQEGGQAAVHLQD